MTEPPENDGTCDNDGCSEPTPMDMPAIVMGGFWFCSPTCAHEKISTLPAMMKHLTLHDPQFAMERDEFPEGVSDDDVGIRWVIENKEVALDLLEEIEEEFPGPFRVTE